MNRNYKVSGRKMTMNFENGFEKADRKMCGGIAGQKECLKSQGESTRHLNPAHPTLRRVKKAKKKVDNGKMKKPRGPLERQIYNEYNRMMAEWANDAMGKGYY